MKTIKHTNILVYYDGVQVFAGRDAVGDHYVGAMIDTVGDAGNRSTCKASATVRADGIARKRP